MVEGYGRKIQKKEEKRKKEGDEIVSPRVSQDGRSKERKREEKEGRR